MSDELNAERRAIADQLRRVAACYPQSSDGRNTFEMQVEWVEARISASPSPAQEPVAWLIEWPDDGNLHPLRWWHGEFGYTRDPNKTPRFARREDAEMAIKYLKLVGAKAVEHLWMDNKVTHPSPSPSLTKAREALQPFAALRDEVPIGYADHAEVRVSFPHMTRSGRVEITLRVEDIRRAATALAALEAKHE